MQKESPTGCDFNVNTVTHHDAHSHGARRAWRSLLLHASPLPRDGRGDAPQESEHAQQRDRVHRNTGLAATAAGRELAPALHRLGARADTHTQRYYYVIHTHAGGTTPHLVSQARLTIQNDGLGSSSRSFAGE